MPSSLLSPPEIETDTDISYDETPPRIWRRLRHLGNREVFTSPPAALIFFCLIFGFQLVAGIFAVYIALSKAPQDPPDSTLSTHYADTCARALTETLAKERSAHHTP